MHHLLTGIDPRTGEAYAPVRDVESGSFRRYGNDNR